MNYEQAIELTGGLSKPSKMPSPSYSIPASLCKTGGKLRNVKNSVCEKCYALKGFYIMGNVKRALQKRFEKILHPKWVDAMVFLIKCGGNSYFRWHDSGDLQSVEHLKQIISVCKKTPQVTHWLPTREYSIISEYKKQGKRIPKNLIVRLSAHMVDQKLPNKLGTNSMVASKAKVNNLPKGVYVCPSSKQGNKCLDCRACWSGKIKTVAYIKH